MLNISVNFGFSIMKKLWDLAHEKLVNILGGHHVGTNIHGCQPYMEIAIYELKSANGGLLCSALYINSLYFWKWTNAKPKVNWDPFRLIYLGQTIGFFAKIHLVKLHYLQLPSLLWWFHPQQAFVSISVVPCQVRTLYQWWGRFSLSSRLGQQKVRVHRESY